MDRIVGLDQEGTGVVMQDLVSFLSSVAFPIAWCAMTWYLARVSGWSELARKYPSQAHPNGESHHFQSGYVGSMSYGFCLTLNVTSEGLGISVFLPLRVGHPPMFIPWNQFHSQNIRRVMLFWWIAEYYVGFPVVGKIGVEPWITDRVLSSEGDVGARSNGSTHRGGDL